MDGEERLSVPVIFFISSTEAVCGTLSASTGFITTCNLRGSSLKKGHELLVRHNIANTCMTLNIFSFSF